MAIDARRLPQSLPEVVRLLSLVLRSLRLRFLLPRMPVNRLVGRPAAGEAADGKADVQRLFALADLASWVVFGSGRCLCRSLLMYAILRRRGVPVTLTIGVLADPAGFRSHAWVEEGGRPLGEIPEGIRAFSPILCLAAP